MVIGDRCTVDSAFKALSEVFIIIYVAKTSKTCYTVYLTN